MLAKTTTTERHWFILTCEPNRERIAASHFVARGFIGGQDDQYPHGRPKAYLPTEVMLRDYTVSTMFGPRRRTRTSIEPIFRGVIFLHFSFATDGAWRRKLGAIPGIHNFRRIGGDYAVVRPVEMDEIVRIEYEANDPTSQKLKQSPFKAGFRVRPKDGPLSDHTMEFLRLDETGRISWLSSRIGRISLPTCDIEAA